MPSSSFLEVIQRQLLLAGAASRTSSTSTQQFDLKLLVDAID
jgi:hypothetical protein